MPNKTSHLKNAFKTAKQYEKKLRKEGWIRVKKPSWILILGEENAGKSSLFEKTGIAKSLSNEIINWWFTQDSVFLEIKNDDELIWKKFLRLSKKYHGKPPFDGLLIAINSHLFFPNQQEKIKNFTQSLKEKLFFLLKTHRNLEVGFIVTQCDRLNGFVEYFDDLDSQERNQSFGFDMVEINNMKIEFERLIRKVSDRLILRLQEEDNSTKRSSLNNFPFLFETLCQKIMLFFCNFSWENVNLIGIYFTSSLQNKYTATWLENLLQQKYLRSRPYFINNTLNRITQFIANTYSKTKWDRIAALPICAAIIIIFTLAWHYSYQTSLQTINLIKNNLTKPIPSDSIPSELLQLNELNALNNTISTLDQPTINFPKWLGFHQSSDLITHLNQKYHHLLISSFQPYLLKKLENEITKNLSANQLQLYSALRIYLMLITPDHYDQEAIQQWFMINWRKKFSDQPNLQKNLLVHLKDLFSIPSLKWSVNSQLVQKAQDSLKKLSLPELAFLELQEKYKSINVSIFPHTMKETGIDISNAKIPFFYSAGNFSEIYNTAIPNIDKTLLKGNWVLGTEKGIKLNLKQKKQLIMEVRKIYLQFYTQQWQAIIPNILLKTPENLDEAENAIVLLLDPNSPFNQALKIVVGNATLLSQEESIKQKNNKYLIAVNNFIQKKGNTPKIQTQLKNLLKYLNNITASQTILKSSFTATSRRFSSTKNDSIKNILQLATQTSDPVKSWLNTVSMGSWKILLKNTREYLNQIWKTSVLIPYKNTIENRYPIFKMASNNITLKNFTLFFGPNGIVQTFFENYLQSFVNIAANYWTWKSVDGQTLNIPQETLDQLLRASLIQQMFFTDVQSRPSFRFNLVPTALSANLASFNLNLSSQTFHISAGKQLIKTFEWPGKSPYFVKLNFVTSDNKTKTIQISGPWSWFKLLDQSELKTTNNPKEFLLLITEESFQTQFQIYADNLINPFIPGVLNTFRCPNKL